MELAQKPDFKPLTGTEAGDAMDKFRSCTSASPGKSGPLVSRCGVGTALSRPTWHPAAWARMALGVAWSGLTGLAGRTGL